ncbi:hypothetical protein COOONC_13909 [Cooperia oncophora]
MWPQMNETTLRDASDSQDPGNGHDALQARKKRILWVASDLQNLADLVELHRRNGKIRWAPLAEAWRRSRSASGVQRSVASLKAAYAKLSLGKPLGLTVFRLFGGNTCLKLGYKSKNGASAPCERPRDSVPPWLCQGRIVLIPKRKGDPSQLEPGDFRPIACLNTCYKILTSMMAVHVNAAVGDRFPGSQVALRKGIWGCTHAQIIDQTIVADAQRTGQELHMLWIDMAKAFDSLPAILWAVKQWGIPSDVRRLLSTLMSQQSVTYYGRSNGRLVRSRPLRIRNGLMQGDSLSPFLFCLTIAPISAWIQAHIQGYRTKTGSGPSL